MAKRWYIIHAYSNFENKVAESIREQAKQRGLSDLFEEVMVPKEKVVEVRRGRKVDAERKFFPGYVLAKMDLTDEAFHLIKNTPKVTGFLGADNKPMPISRRCPSKSASRSACPTVRSHPSTAPWKRWTTLALASRSPFRSSAEPRLSSWNSLKSRRVSTAVPIGWVEPLRTPSGCGSHEGC